MTYRFSAVITKDEDWYVARCPELRVTSEGKTVEEALANLREAVELYIETWGAPETVPGNEPFMTTLEVTR
jgi:predicted RNase H-like HicB family nuclease